MLSENDEISARVSALAALACQELFAAYGVTLDRTQARFEEFDGSVMSGVMGFVGTRLRGTCLLASEPYPLEISCPAGGRTRDWIGELTNQLVGRLKTKLMAHGVEVFVTTPIVLTGARVQPIPRGLLLPSVFAAAGGNVLVWVEAESGHDLILSTEARIESAEEGEILLF
jgi:hypothetical protein